MPDAAASVSIALSPSKQDSLLDASSGPAAPGVQGWIADVCCLQYIAKAGKSSC